MKFNKNWMVMNVGKRKSQLFSLGAMLLIRKVAYEIVDFKKNIQPFWDCIKWTKSRKTTVVLATHVKKFKAFLRKYKNRDRYGTKREPVTENRQKDRKNL